MARKKKPEEHENHERWLVSYADFITLLFAFFVVMYSISSINEGKYRVLSDSIVSAFDPSRDGLPLQMNSPLRPPIIDRDIISKDQDAVRIENQFPTPQSGIQPSAIDMQAFEKISEAVSESLAPLIEDDLIKVTNNDLWVEIEINSNILFSSGKAALAPNAVPVLRRISGILKDFPNQIQVEGFTDNIPIDTPEFPSNWELSAARAASVVHLFTLEGLSPNRLSAVGYGEYKPLASNDTAAGRQENRRINIIVLSDAIARTSNRTEQLEKSLASRRAASKSATEALQESIQKSFRQPETDTAPQSTQQSTPQSAPVIPQPRTQAPAQVPAPAPVAPISIQPINIFPPARQADAPAQ